MAGHTNNKNAKKNKKKKKGAPFGGKKAAPFKAGNKAGRK